MRTNKSEIGGICIAIILFVFLGIVGNYKTKPSGQVMTTGQLSKDFTEIETEVDQFLEDPSNLTLLINWSKDSIRPDEIVLNGINSYTELDFQLAVLGKNKYLAWTSQNLIDIRKIPFNQGWQLVDDSIFVKTYPLKSILGSSVNLILQFKLPGKFSKIIQANSLSEADKKNAIVTKENKLIALPTSELTAPNHVFGVWMVFFYMLAYLSLIFSVSSFLKNNHGKLSPRFIVLVALIPILFRGFDYLGNIGSTIDQYLISLSVADKPFLSKSYGNLLLLIIFYFLFTDFILDSIRPVKWLRQQKYGKAKFSFFLFSLDYLGLVCLLIFCRELVVNSGINFDFKNVFNLGVGPISSIILLTILLFRYVLLSYKINLNLVRNKINFKYKAIGVFGSFLFVLPLIYFTNLNLPIYILLLVVLLFSLLFDIFIEFKSPTLGWLVVWIIFFAAFATTSLFKFNNDKEREEKLQLIDNLKEKNDTIFDRKFARATTNLKNNQLLHDGFSKAIFERNINLGTEMLQIALSKEGYIQDYYAVDYYVKYKDSILIASQPNLTSSFPISGIKFTEEKSFLKAFIPNNYHSYYYKIYWQDPGLKPSPEIYFFVRKKLIVPQSYFSESNSYFMDLRDLSKYDYAIYKNDKLIESQGRIYPDKINSNAMLAHDEILELSSQRRSELMSQLDPSTVIVIGKELLGIIKPISLFSFLFVLLTLMVIIVSFVNSWIRILPAELPLLFNGQFNLRQRIEYSILLVIVTSFVIIAWITSIYFRDLSSKMEENQLSGKAYALVSDIENKIQSLGSDSLSNRNLAEISIVHQTEFNLYSPDGSLMYESRSYITDPYRKSKFIEPQAYIKLHFGGMPIYNHSNTSGSIDKAYVPIKNGSQSKVAWLEVPFSAGSNQSYFAVSDFLGTLLNVYVFLLLVAGAIAIGVANSITRPLVNLVEKLKLIKLDKKNEPLQWSQQDEIGSLIKEYNNMIDKLEQSAILLIKSEREGAWRDMAQQVAHEIKNPLTPMKLSIQYLERKVLSAPQENLEQTVRDTARTIIEQIDNLASIATEFSNFAKMPAPVMEYINFNELVSSIHELFRKKDDVNFNLYVPIDDIIILADRSHLLRVLNNLVQNAIQSIPPGRHGQIGLKLKIEENMAVLTVKDNGLGIPESMFDKVFYPRFTTKSSGMGLGLAMCKSIVESINGLISFNSKVDIGTEFIVKIPIAASFEEEEDLDEIE